MLCPHPRRRPRLIACEPEPIAFRVSRVERRYPRAEDIPEEILVSMNAYPRPAAYDLANEVVNTQYFEIVTNMPLVPFSLK